MKWGASLEAHGFAIVPDVLTPTDVAALCDAVRPTSSGTGLVRHGGDTYAIRGLLWQMAGLPEMLESLRLNDLARRAIGATAFPVDATLFNKIRGANWAVPGHQDVVVPVDSEVPAAGFCGWTVRRGGVYVEPPLAVLERMVALRVHLDDCGADNGPLAVVPDSHRAGRWDDDALRRLPLSSYQICEAGRGDVLMMRPLIVHRSSPARDPRSRRVLHVVYATEEPSAAVRWRRAPTVASPPLIRGLQ